MKASLVSTSRPLIQRVLVLLAALGLLATSPAAKAIGFIPVGSTSPVHLNAFGVGEYGAWDFPTTSPWMDNPSASLLFEPGHGPSDGPAFLDYVIVFMALPNPDFTVNWGQVDIYTPSSSYIQGLRTIDTVDHMLYFVSAAEFHMDSVTGDWQPVVGGMFNPTFVNPPFNCPDEANSALLLTGMLAGFLAVSGGIRGRARL